MNLYDYLIIKTIPEREKFAKNVGTTVGYLHQLMYKNRNPSAALAKKIEVKSGKRVSAKELLNL